MNNSPLSKKTLALCLGLVSLFSVALFTPPQTSRADPLILGGILGGVLGIDFFSCGFNILFFCDSSGGGNVVGSNNGGNGIVQNPCTSAANACGQTNNGYFGSDGVTCSATPPPNSSCPAPVIDASSFSASPSTVGVNESSTLTWNVSDATSCTITGDNGFSSTGGNSGSISTGNLPQTTIFTLTCQDGDGGPTASGSVKVIIAPHWKEI